METRQLYLYDSYNRDFKAKINLVKSDQVVLYQTLFHPLTGGVSFDMGYLEKGNEKHRVLRVEINHETKEIIHVLESAESLILGDVVKGVLDWERRYRLMRLHTAAHLIAAIMYKDHDALITGGQVDYERASNF